MRGRNLMFAMVMVSSACARQPAPAVPMAPAHDLNGIWALEPAFTDDGRPTYAGSVDWAPLSQGRPEDRKPPTAEQIRAGATPPPATLNVFTAGLLGGSPLPLTEAGKRAREAIKAEYPTREDENSPKLCTPANRSGMGGPMVQIVQSPGAIALYGEQGARLIFLDGRNFERSALPQWAGYSIGHWEGEVLVVETRHFKGDYLRRFPMSEAARLTEYFARSADGKSMTVKTIFEDPNYFTEPMGSMVYLHSHPDLDVIEDVCLEGLKDTIDYGPAPKASLKQEKRS